MRLQKHDICEIEEIIAIMRPSTLGVILSCISSRPSNAEQKNLKNPMAAKAVPASLPKLRILRDMPGPMVNAAPEMVSAIGQRNPIAVVPNK